MYKMLLFYLSVCQLQQFAETNVNVIDSKYFRPLTIIRVYSHQSIYVHSFRVTPKSS